MSRFYERFGKRSLDVLLAAGAVAALSPVMAATAAAIWLEDRGTPLFRQQRVGRDGKPFTILKFRSMPLATPNVPSAGATKLRVTRVGKWIRRLNVDELPQLFNILAGEMSVVGPRPALPSQQTLTELRGQNGALRCKPGLTGLAQIRSYDGMPEAEKAELDSRYAVDLSLLRDVRIIAATFAYLLKPPPTY